MNRSVKERGVVIFYNDILPLFFRALIIYVGKTIAPIECAVFYKLNALAYRNALKA